MGIITCNSVLYNQGIAQVLVEESRFCFVFCFFFIFFYLGGGGFNLEHCIVDGNTQAQISNIVSEGNSG